MANKDLLVKRQVLPTCCKKKRSFVTPGCCFSEFGDSPTTKQFLCCRCNRVTVPEFLGFSSASAKPKARRLGARHSEAPGKSWVWLWWSPYHGAERSWELRDKLGGAWKLKKLAVTTNRERFGANTPLGFDQRVVG